MKHEATHILQEARVKGFMTRQEQERVTEILKDEFLADRACINIAGKNACFDDFVGVYLPESGEYIRACSDIKNSNLNDVFHKVLDSYIEVCIVNLGFDELTELFENGQARIGLPQDIMESLNKLSIER